MAAFMSSVICALSDIRAAALRVGSGVYGRARQPLPALIAY